MAVVMYKQMGSSVQEPSSHTSWFQENPLNPYANKVAAKVFLFTKDITLSYRVFFSSPILGENVMSSVEEPFFVVLICEHLFSAKNVYFQGHFFLTFCVKDRSGY